MDSLEEKYLKLLAEYEELEENHPCIDNLKQCNSAYYRLNNIRFALVQNIKSLYSSWMPPKMYSFFTSMKALFKSKFKKSNLQEHRLSICSTCEYLTKDVKMCQLCGCLTKYKTGIPGAACPIAKWKAEE